MMTLFEAAGLCKHFSGVYAVNDVGFTVEKGSTVAVIGPNGAGKTTLINLVTGVTRPDAGSIQFNGHDITGAPLHRLAAKGLSRSFQHPRIFRNMTVLDNVMVAAQQHHPVGMLSAGLKLRRARAREAAAAEAGRRALRQVNLECDPDLPANLLTTGQDKLLELARLLVAEPVMLFLDEPAAGLDDHETADLTRRIRAINESGITIALVEHNMQLVMDLADSITVIDSGRIIAQGPPADVRADPAVIAAYLGSGTELTGAVDV
ncbi:ABC transporter ATP-binding protein [Streptomyces sp. NPDC050560]|uniref:ABC transporter ATP-binding protein n=1 Tax=Streptomyces sp. NPDC050560 TaxID=3365630 RepID=UPI0037BDD09D